MSDANTTPSRAALAAGFATIYLVWGSTYLGIRIAVESLPPFLMIAVRFLVAGTLMTAWIAATRGFRATRRQWLDNTIIGGLLLLGGTGLVSWAEQKVPSGITTLIVALGPLFIVLIDWAVYSFSRDPSAGTRPTAATFAGVGLGIAGLLVLVGPQLGTGAGHLDPRRVGGLILACLSWSAGSIYARYTRSTAEPFTAAAIQMLAGSFWLFLVSALLGEPGRFHFADATTRSLFAWAYLVVAGSLLAFPTYVWLMKHCVPARVSTYAYVNPVIAVFLGWRFADEPVGPRVFAGAAIIIVAVALLTADKLRKGMKSPPRQGTDLSPPADIGKSR